MKKTTPFIRGMLLTTILTGCLAGCLGGGLNPQPTTSSKSIPVSGGGAVTYQVTYSGDSYQTLTPATPQTIDSGNTASITVTPDSGYGNLTAVGGTCPAGSWNGNIYTSGAITSNCSLSFSSTVAYTVTPSGSANQTLLPSTSQVINSGSTTSFTVTPNSGYINSSTVGGTCAAGSWNGTIYTTGPITGNCSVSFNAQCTTCRIFLSFTSYGGNLGGLAGADAKCMTDSNKPVTGTFKALLGSQWARMACVTADCSGGISENSGWVLYPNTPYTRNDGTPVGTTNSSAIFAFPLTNSIDTSNVYVMTGIATDWTTNGRECKTSTPYDDDSSGGAGLGQSDQTSASAIYATDGGCGAAFGRYIYCVEQ